MVASVKWTASCSGGWGSSAAIVVTRLERFVVGCAAHVILGIFDNIERLEMRIAFLKAHNKKIRRVALIKTVHLESQDSSVLQLS